MEGDEYGYDAGVSQQSNHEDGGFIRKKKKKSKKTSRNLMDDLNDAQIMFPNSDDELFTQEDNQFEESVSTSSPSKKKKKRKKAKEETQSQEDEEEDYNTSQTSTYLTPKATSTPAKSQVETSPKTPGPAAPGSSKTTKKTPAATPSNRTPIRNSSDGVAILAEMSTYEVETLLNRIEEQCPEGDMQKLSARMEAINWTTVSFGPYRAEQCKLAWGCLMTQTRKYRVMSELVQEVKHNFKTDYKKHVKKLITSLPDYPKHPGSNNGFHLYLKEMWEKHKAAQEKTNKKTDNYLIFQKKFQEKWKALGEAKQREYAQKSKLVYAEYKQKCREFHMQYASFGMEDDDLESERGGEPTPEKTGLYYQKKALELSKKLYTDAPKLPSTPCQLYGDSKIKKLDPDIEELPMLKARYNEQWKELSRAKKLKYIEKCLKYYRRFQQEVTEYKKEHPLYVLPREFQVGRILNKEELSIWAENHGCPTCPMNTCIAEYVKIFKEKEGDKLEGMSNKEIYDKANQKWNQLETAEKNEFQLQWKIRKLQFVKQVNEFIQQVDPMLKAGLIDNLPKVYQKQFWEEVDKEPLVGDNDMLELDGGTGTSGNGSSLPGTKRKWAVVLKTPVKKRRLGEKVEEGEIPLFAEDMSDEQKRVVFESLKKSKEEQTRQRRISNLSKADNYFPGQEISPRKKTKKNKSN